MHTTIQTKDLRIPAFAERWLDQALTKIRQHHSNLMSLKARVSREGKFLFRVQLFAKLKGQEHVIETRQPHLFAAITEATDRLQRQLQRSKERTQALVKKRKRNLRWSSLTT